MKHDLVLRGGRVIDPSQGVDATGDIGFSDGKVAEIGERLEARMSAMSRDSSLRPV